MKKLFCLLCALSLSACMGTSAPSDFYTLQVVAPSQALSQKALTVGVEKVKVAGLLDRPQIVLMENNGVNLSVSETNRWAEPLPSMLQRTLVADLQAYLPKATIKETGFLQQDFPYILTIEINQFTGTLQDKVVLNAWWTITNNRGKILYQQQEIMEKPLGTDYTALVKTQSILIGELAHKIASHLSSL